MMSEDKPKPISETVSKKGRPPRFDERYVAMLKGLHPEITTERGLLNLCYRQNAVSVIRDAKSPKLNWLCDFEGMKAGRDDAWRPTILIELGKIDDHDAMLAIAERVCELKPGTREAVAMIRNYRLDEREPDTLQLANEIIHTINDYWKRFPKLTQRQILSAIATAEAQVKGE
jgi:hypothetical protein